MVRKWLFFLSLPAFLIAFSSAQNQTSPFGIEEVEHADVKKICLVAITYALLGDVFEPDLIRNELYYVSSIKKWKMVVTERKVTPQGNMEQTVVCYVSGSKFDMRVETIIK